MRKNTFASVLRGLRRGTQLMLFARQATAAALKTFLVRKLNNIPDLKGGLETLELRLLQGMAVVRGFYIAKSSDGRPLVEVYCREIRVHLEWRELLHGALVGRVDIIEPQVEISTYRKNSDNSSVSSKSQEDALLALCRETRQMMPFHLRTVEVRDGYVDYFSEGTTPRFKLSLGQISFHASNLTNHPRFASVGSAEVFVSGETTGNGQLWVRLIIPSLAEALTFDLQTELKHLNLVALNDLLRAYAKFDLRRGVCSIAAEFSVIRGRYKGFVQPHFKDLDIFAWQKEHGKSFFQICRQAVIGFLAGIFKNQARDELAMNIPITGTFTESDVDTVAAVGSLLKNAFVRSLLPRSDESLEKTVHQH